VYDELIEEGFSEDEVEHVVELSDPDLIFHSNSTYPCPIEDLNLEYINWLKAKYPKREIGYSGHEFGLVPTFVAATQGVTWIERHITLDRTMWGSDHMSSVEPAGLIKLVKGLNDIAKCFGHPGPRKVTEGEYAKRKSLRG
ncbi:MAG: N-acetylneuraminate synthase family protein, partial [Acholeplasmataceae bacterium]